MKTETQVLEQIRGVIVNVLNGRYEHKQDAWHCGTAACIAGWCQLEDVSTQLNKSFADIQLSLTNSDSEVIEGYFNAEEHVLVNIKDRKLDQDIRDFIFASNLTIKQIVNGFNKVIARHSICVSPIIIMPSITDSNLIKVKV